MALCISATSSSYPSSLVVWDFLTSFFLISNPRSITHHLKIAKGFSVPHITKSEVLAMFLMAHDRALENLQKGKNAKTEVTRVRQPKLVFIRHPFDVLH